jgi:Zn-dependent protease
MHSFLNIHIQFGFLVIVALSLFVIPIQWVAGWLFAAIIHELSHISAMQIMRIKIVSITLKQSGAVIKTEAMVPFQEFICALCGPLSGFVTFILMRRLFPQAALCALVQAAYNLIPIYPLDGGRALRCAFASILEIEHAKLLSNCISVACIVLVAVITVYILCKCDGKLITIILIVLLVALISKYFLQRE